MLTLFRKEVRNFETYTTMRGDHRIWLDKNESPFDLPAGMKTSIFNELKELEFNRYPDISGLPLREKIAEHIGFDVSEVVVGNGSDQLIDNVLDLYEGRRVIIHSPTFGMYSFYTRKKGLELVDIPLDEDYDIPDIRCIDGDIRAIFICSPNTPTGNLISRERISEVLDSGYPVILDEAYVDFADKSNLDLVRDYDNLLVLRTMSKAYGLAALRVGYSVASSGITKELSKIVSPYTINKISLKIAQMVFDDREYIEECIEYIKNERDRMISELPKYSNPSQTNFVMFDLDAYDYLLKRGIVVRKLSGRLSGKIRITVGTKEENTEVIEALKKFIDERGC